MSDGDRGGGGSVGAPLVVIEVVVVVEGSFTSCMNFLQIGRISLLSVAENIITCLPCGVLRKISWTSRRMSKKNGAERMNEKNVNVSNAALYAVYLCTDKCGSD